MDELKGIWKGLGASSVETNAQSGNLVFDYDEGRLTTLAQEAGDLIFHRFDIRPKIILLSADEFGRAVRNNPFGVSDEVGSTLHFGFLSREPLEIDHEKIEAIRAPSEDYQLIGKVFYLLAPEGVGRSKLAAQIEKILGVDLTDRNWNTVRKIQEIIANSSRN